MTSSYMSPVDRNAHIYIHNVVSFLLYRTVSEIFLIFCRKSRFFTPPFFHSNISPVMSKVFEYCIFDKLQSYSGSCDKQFGFKKGHGCRTAMYTIRKIVDDLNKVGSMVNTCAIDSRKAFDKSSHCALYIKFRKRLVPVELLEILENWLSECFTHDR